ncbi:tyrosine-protein phosphatase 69D isoform X1 [Tribolium madens]|uniref:tyrosine-protein phosphatase 69D isoform X1 n=1 Tax=Tribolium madens TaxID=41895 RepID=UPI001CF73363|nr:tyrosine-protein phosphatase 69D isoform X1 [Tribolium madens]
MFSCQAHYFSIFLIVCVFSKYYVKCNAVDPEDDERAVTIEVLNYNPNQLPFGGNVTIICKSEWIDSFILWTFCEKNITDGENGFKLEMESENINTQSGKKSEVSILHIVNLDLKHIGEYTCHSTHKNELDLDFCKITLNVTLPAQIVQISPPIHTKLHKDIELYCVIEGYPLEEIKWFRDNDSLPAELWSTKTLNDTRKNTTLTIKEVTKKDNATYTCVASTGHSTANATSAILVLDKPQVSIEFVKAIGIDKIYFNWTVNDGNDPENLRYTIQYMSSGDSTWIYFQEEIDGKKRSHVLKGNFKNNTEYKLRILAKNSEGKSQYSYSDPVRMLSEDPVFIPEVKVTGVTVSSITISWSTPTEDLKDHVQYYTLYLKTNNSSFNAIHPASKENYHMFSELDPATTYYFQVAACSEYSGICGPPSEVVNGTTMDGISGPPFKPTIQCRFDNISQVSFVHVTWQAPIKPHGIIISYNVHLEGSASFINDQGLLEHTTWGPKLKSVRENTFNTRFNNVSANTNYTVKISGVTRTKKNGEAVELHCTMPSMLPDKQKLSQLYWLKMEEQGKWLFKLLVPRVSERNGPICCYRIYLVRMEDQQKLAELPAPEDLSIVSYQEAHRTPRGGAYVAEMFTSETFQGEVFLGDDQVFNLTSNQCDECIGLRPYNTPREIKKDDINSTVNRVRREERLSDPLPPFDGTLDISSNYTGFVEIIVYGNSTKSSTIAAYSNYLVMMNPGPEVVAAPLTGTLSLVVQILCGLVMIVLLLLGALCILHHYTKQAHAQAVEITFRTSLRHLYRSLRGRQRLVSLNPPDMCPISKGELVSAYIERHRDSDYGFQQEFELLPDRFSDRTTRASDARENVYKNRYPDIKAYDQTRVKLSQIDSIAGSDYINANFVMGYKERKKFICAQGPMDTTVNEFWRMIWEQHLELILMLTNLEEYSKTKCAKYWPDKCDGDKCFGDITVTHVQETRYSDYIVRELRIARNAPGKDKEERQITQYHYLVWKDFMAPEHPNGIIKFIKRVNEAYSIEKGCILIHCSAGVGRTGTLVALDCLLQQLKEEEHVSIFNTICDLRHQRNFLVQSLKQYIFIYRALMEVAQYGDTEISANELKVTVDKLRQCDKDKAKCKLEEEFENILNAFEDRKSCSVAKGDENREKNRSDVVIPYDRNRVILTPLSGKEHSTYINASFIEGYDNTESFIITQDPTESTINDFWRMISEQGISVIVMLSELGENKCPRYWPDEDEGTYDHITVRYEQAESCPYYTRREMYIKSRDCEDQRVIHLQYHGWPTVDGEVPEVTRGLTELVDQSQSALVHNDCSPSMVVHCSLGSDRSSMFVGLTILVQQLRTEKRVDVFTVTRKLRSQRNGLISSYAQYEFLHRAIVNYAELHGLCD